jgi:hypothetical protein
LVLSEDLRHVELHTSFAEEFEALVVVLFSTLSSLVFNQGFHLLEFEIRVGLFAGLGLASASRSSFSFPLTGAPNGVANLTELVVIGEPLLLLCSVARLPLSRDLPPGFVYVEAGYAQAI